MKRFASFFSLLILAAFLLNSATVALACGPSFVTPVFAFKTRPDEQLDAYSRGEIGIIKPNYNRSFLFAAYRYFNNAPFSAAEQKDLVSIWKAELYRIDDKENETNKAVNAWLAVRKKVLNGEPEPKIYTDRSYDNGYFFFPNCTANAFETASQTLENRITKYGASDENVKIWTRGQDQVFTNCSEGKQMPEEIGAAEWLKNDRDYQIAAANFYGTNLVEAKNRFEKIGANKESVWQSTANYLVARTLIRQASQIEDEDYNFERLREKRRPFYEQAEAQLQRILSDSSQRDFHPAAVKLINLVKYRLHPEERIHELASILSQKQPDESFRQNLIDYRWLMDRFSESSEIENQTTKGENSKATPRNNIEQSRQDDVTDWIFTFQNENAEAYRHSLEKWRETQSPAWLVASLAKAGKDAPEVQQLLTEAGKIEKSSPAYVMAAFHQNRLLIEKGLRSEARNNLDSILNDKTLTLPVSSRNQLLSQRMFLAENLDSFLQFAQRRAAAFALDELPGAIEDFSAESLKDWEAGSNIAQWRNRSMFDDDAVRAFNEQIPLSILKQAAVSPKLPEYLRRNLLIATWTRAILLENEQTAQEIAPQLIRLAPEFQTIFSPYINAQTPAERASAATYVLLKLPALRPFAETGYGRIIQVTEIDNYRDNWWCAPDDFEINDNGERVARAASPAPAFLSAEQIKEAGNERDLLKKAGNSSTYLSRRAVEFATKSPNDVRVPESLHLAVRATRYGCQDCETGKYSKQAFDILKNRFPRTDWKRKTPYWFKDESCETKQ